MATRSYENLDVVVGRGPEPGAYEARIISSPAGEAGPESFALTLSADRMALLLMQMAPGVIRSRRVAAPDTQAAEELGGALFEALFRGSLRTTLNDSIAAAPNGLRVRLRTTHAPELARLPWELLHDKGRLKFLALSERTPIVRYLELAQSTRALAITGPLRILVVISSPSGLPALDVEAEWNSIQAQLAPLTSANLLEVDRLPSPTLGQLRQWLRVHEVHVLHFIGHGEFDAVREDGVLYFTDDAGNPRPVDPAGLGPHLSDHDPLRLVVLNACQTGRSADDDPFGGMAQGLVERGIPAVVAMQFPISDAAAVCFAGDFYAALAAGQPVDQAMSGARRALLDTSGGEWATPVLFLRSEDGRLFSVSSAAVESRDATVPVTPAAAAADRPVMVDGPGPGDAITDRPSTVGPKVESQAAGRTDEGAQAPRAGHRPLWIFGALVVAIVAGLGIWMLASRTVTDPPPGPADASTSPAEGTAQVVIPDVYNLAQADGLARLASAGFSDVSSSTICSSSVGEGLIRVVWSGSPPKKHVVDENGSASQPIPVTTPLTVGVSSGVPCN